MKESMVQINNNKFVGRDSSHICFAPKTLIIATIAIPVIVLFGIVPDFELSLKLLSIEIICLILLIRNRIWVTKGGIRYHKKYFLWSDIQTIGITVTSKGIPNRLYNRMIYISEHRFEKPVHILDTRNSEIKDKPEGIEIINYISGKPDYLITASFNRRLIRHIIAYWGTDIKNLNETPGWNSYVKFYNFFHRNITKPEIKYR